MLDSIRVPACFDSLLIWTCVFSISWVGRTPRFRHPPTSAGLFVTAAVIEPWGSLHRCVIVLDLCLFV